MITYHIFVIITVIIRLSRVGVTVSDQVLHGAAKSTRHCGQTGNIVNIFFLLIFNRNKPTTLFSGTVPMISINNITSGGIVIRQTDQSIAGTRLTVGEAGGRDVVYDLVGL